MDITPEIDTYIKIAVDELTTHCHYSYDWDTWLRDGIKNNTFPYSCSLFYEGSGHNAIQIILKITGNEDMIDEFDYDPRCFSCGC